MATKRLALVHLVIGSALLACRAGPQPDPPPRLTGDRQTNLLIVTLDTTRADRLGAYGFKGIETPHLDRLAREGVLFRQALSVAPLTLPAHSSLFTGLNPPRHGVHDNAGVSLAPSQTTLAEIVSSQGFRTGAFVASSILEKERGLAQGFDTYADDLGEAASGKRRRRALELPANRIISRAIDWLNHLGPSRFLLWVHLYDPHEPYDPPAPYRSRYRGDPYAGEIAFMDEQIGRLLGFVEERHLLDRTAVIVVGDHGESLGEHGEAAHGVFVYDSVLRVPFIVRAPWVRVRRPQVDPVTRLIDVLPTALDLAGLPPAPVEGVSVVPLMKGEVGDRHLDAYAESLYPRYRFGWSELYALRSGRFKFIEAPRPELYDVAEDPGETRNLYAARLDVARSMRARLRTVVGTADGDGPAAGAPAVIDREAVERLQALGYVGTLANSPTSDRRATLPDPKDQLVIHNRRVSSRLPGGYP